MDKDPILAVAIHAARRAASVLVDVSRDLKRRPGHAKGLVEVVVNADTEAENAMIATLRAAYPEHAIVGKEAGEIVSQIVGGNRASRNTLKWIVDPLDGAVNFRHGYPYYAVSIALTHGNEVTHAVVLDPVHDDLFSAIKGKGAQLNGTPIRASTCVRIEDALVGTAIPAFGSARLAAYLPVLNAMIPKCAGIRRGGASALDLAYVASGRLDGYWERGLNPWNVAAGALLVVEAGGRVGDFAGGLEFLRTKDVIAAAPGVFSLLRDAIAGAAPAR
ncbi:MAG: inositol monophosphatase family protein [Casimicrobiaceae bacterium]